MLWLRLTCERHVGQGQNVGNGENVQPRLQY